MEKQKNNSYQTPNITEIEIDTDISLAMASSPPDNAPGESMLIHPQNSPYPSI